jgi:predicted AlkP superfamily phosphohydrolase/phosphomutase
MTNRQRVLLIGLDAAEPALIRRWSQEGHLPNLGKLLEGVASNLKSVAPEFPDEVWPSIYASQNAAQTGKYYYIQLQPGTLKFHMLDDKPRGEQFWSTASKAGRRCAVIDAPKTALAPSINGIQIANWGCHATRCATASHPPELLAKVLSEYGPYPLPTCDMHSQAPAEYRDLRQKMLAGIEMRAKLLRDLLASEPWDLFFCGFCETHCAGHQLWHLQDDSGLGEESVDLRTALRDICQAIDRAIGSLVERAGPDTCTIVFSGHGMQPQYHGRDLLPALLEMWGLAGQVRKEPGGRRERVVVGNKDLVQRLKEAVPIRWQYAVKRALPRKLEHALIARFMGRGEADPRALAFAVPNNELVATIRVSLAGRDPQGMVAPGRPYEELCDWISTRLRELINPTSGQLAIAKISRMKDSYSGPHMDLLPDLTARWSGDAPLDEVYSPGYGTVIGSHVDRRSGGHAGEGFLALQDPTGHARFDLANASGKDIAPTVLRLLDVPVPTRMEGRSLATVATSTLVAR